MHRLFIIFLSLMLLVSCSSGGESQPKGWIFDISDYVSELSSGYENKKVLKRVTVNGEVEEKEIDFNLELELGPLVRSDVNILSLMDRYKCDTLNITRDSLRIVHVALDSKLRTKRIEVEKSNDRVGRIYVENSYQSLISSSEETIEWVPNKRYHLSKEDNSMFRDPVRLDIDIRMTE